MTHNLKFPLWNTDSGDVNKAIERNIKMHNSIVRDACIDKSPNVDRKKLDKAIEDTCSWMVGDYRYIDWEQYQSEVGDIVENILNYANSL